MISNSNSGGLVVDMFAEFRAYDRLPKDVRNALANAPLKLSAYSLAGKKWPKERMLEAIAEKSRTPILLDQGAPI